MLPAAAAPPLDDDNLLTEILLRLPPLPSSLPRASLVCKRWRCLASDPVFRRRFRIHHRRNPPLLGCFVTDLHRRRVSFVSTLEAPNRVPSGRLSLQLGSGDQFRVLNCRHGLLLMYIASWKQILVWDPVTAYQHRLAVPPGFESDYTVSKVCGAVVRSAGDDHFQVVLVGMSKQQHKQAAACIYSAEAGVWGKIISTPIPSEVYYSGTSLRYISFMAVPAVLVGDSLYWLIAGHSPIVLELDLHRQILNVIRFPVDMFAKKNSQFWIMRAGGGGIGCLFLLDCNAQLWKRKNEYDGVASWVLERTIELDKLLTLNPNENYSPVILAVAEHENLVFLWTVIGFFTVQLESLQFKKIFETNCCYAHQPFEGVYTAETGNGGGHDGAAVFLNT